MASGRRGGPPDLKSTLGSLLRTTLDQASAVREVVEQQTRTKGGLLDQALNQRKRTSVLARLGEEVYGLAKRGEIGELLLEPEVGMLIAELENLDDGDDDYNAGRASGPDAVSSADYASRFQGQRGAEPGGQSEYRVWRPVMPEDADMVDIDEDEPATVEDEVVAAIPSRSSRMPQRSASRRGGGIHFGNVRPSPEESDEDLESYMHEDDVPED